MAALLRKEKLSNVPREVRLYHLCTKFKCLPTNGGILEQDPLLLEAFFLIMNCEAEHQENKRKKQEIEKQRNKPKK